MNLLLEVYNQYIKRGVNSNIAQMSLCSRTIYKAIMPTRRIIMLDSFKIYIYIYIRKYYCFRPLHCAVQMGHTETVELLIRFGADVNAKDRNQYTPLHVVAASGMETVSRMLINAGADVNSQNAFGNTPLHIACLNSHLNICQDLVNSGANKEATNFRGQTPLHIAAASTGGVDCTVFLLQHNVEINKQSLDGRTPLHMTAIHGRFTRSKMLIDKGITLFYLNF